MQKVSKNKIKRDRIFDIYSKNFDWVKEHPNIRFEPDISDLYICPLCMSVFDRSCTSAESLTPLTLEDIPPKSLGGKPLVLTCKTCNSKAGHDLDIHLLNVLKEEALQNMNPNSKGKVVIEKDNNKMNGTIKITKNKETQLDLRPEISNPSNTKYIVDKILNKRFRTKTEEFSVIFKKRGNLRRAEIGLLRLAYLLAFAKFGYGFIMNLNLQKIREQIQNPDKDILKQVFCLKANFEDNYLGTSIIYEPKELFGFLVVFKLKSQNFNRNFGVILPGPTPPGMGVYSFIDNKLNMNDGTKDINFLMQPFASTNFLLDKKYAFASHELWHHIVSGKFKSS